ncbi:3-oxoacyl-ACP synthase [Campylobacter aviculae]|uniref:3-oxoacyl-ACP synthase n=1 Tax=Campylobacter aviculae TaxID=2510190 RepID=A0A4U7BM94_9BACT|nr:3-oxoacyl-ACP synthase [Campylobacter aviculae]TKX32839.1 3-oxoacyl-ACP synthase [Campylobacter aviculae]
MCGLTQTKFNLFQKTCNFSSHYIANENTFASDLAIEALDTLLKNDVLSKEELDVIFLATHTPDFFAPQTSSIIHKKLNLNKKTICIDTTAFCSGFLQTLMQAFLMLDNPNIHKIVILTSLVKSKKIDIKNDKISYLTHSDCACAILIEKSQDTSQKTFFSQNIYSQYALEETLPLNAYNTNFNEYLYINNGLFFDFASKNYPEFFDDFFEYFDIDKTQIANFFFHTPNEFFLQKMLENLCLNNFPCFHQVFRTYGDCKISNLPIELCLYKQNDKIGTASQKKGGGE